MKVLVACEFSGIVRDAFLKKGHDAISCDLLPTESPGPHIQDDVLNHLNENWDLMIAHPPCTYLCVSGARWFDHPNFPDRRIQQKEAIDFFMLFINAPIDKICVENPVGIMSTVYRKPDQYIQPYHFGHNEPKKTGLWLKNLPKLNATNIVNPEYQIYKSGKRMGKRYAGILNLFPSETRWMERSRTFQGIANAMANQWG